MAFEVNDNGVSVQTRDEIFEDLVSAYQAPENDGGFGTDFDMSVDSEAGRNANIYATREALLQSALAASVQGLNLDGASGAQLDYVGALKGFPRKAAAPSSIPAIMRGTPGTVIGDKRVRYTPTGDLWRTPAGLEIGPNGQVETTELQSESTGPIRASVGGTSKWAIVDLVSGWDSVESTDNARLGRSAEGNDEYRDRLKDSKSRARGTEPGIRGALGAIPGSSGYTFFNNRSNQTQNGLDAKSAESIVDGGTDEDVATTVYEYYCGGTKFVGNVSYTISDPSDGTLVPVKFSRRENVTIVALITLTVVTGAVLPANARTLATNAVVDAVNALKGSVSVDPDYLSAVARLSLAPELIGDDAGLVARLGDPLAATPAIIAKREKAVTSGEDQPAEIVGTETGPFSLVVGDSLILSADGGAPFSLTINNADYADPAAVTINELETAWSGQAPGTIIVGQQGGSITIETLTAGPVASLFVSATSSPGLLTALGLPTGTVTGAPPNVSVTFV